MSESRANGSHILRCRWCAFSVPAERYTRNGQVVNGFGALSKHTKKNHPEEAKAEAEDSVAAAAERLRSAERLAQDSKRRFSSFLPRTDDDAGPRS